jgi:hypothetical protein
MYTPDDFNLDNTPREMVQYVIDHVENFHERYNHALNKIGIMRAPLHLVDWGLFNDISEAMAEWAIYDSNLTDEEFEELDVEEIFG